MKFNWNTLMYACMLGTSLLISSCHKDEDDPETPPVTGFNKVSFELTHKVGASVLDMSAGSYVNSAGNTFSVSMFKYYISNISFTNKDGSEYIVPTSVNESTNYFLVDETQPDSKTIIIEDVPAGDYTAVSFMIGIDSVRNVSGAQNGDLDPLKGMFWDWNQGYIFLKLEGNSPDATSGFLNFHIGGFLEPNNTIRKVALSLAVENITVRTNIAPEIHTFVDLAKMFDSPNPIDFSSLSGTLGGPNAVKIADNYVNMFSVDHVHNEVQ